MVATAAPTRALRRRLSSWHTAWLQRRIPAAAVVTLDQRRLFIFPTLAGAFFLCMLLVMLLAALNYQNNMSYALCFLLGSVFVVGILHTYANLAGLSLSGIAVAPVFCGNDARFQLRLHSSRQRNHYHLAVSLTGGAPSWIDVPADGEVDICLIVPAGRRGWLRPGRLRIEGRYPLGLLRCWTLVDLELAALVYPRPLPVREPEQAQGRGQGSGSGSKGSDDFHGLRDYRRGDSLKQIHWRSLAKGAPLSIELRESQAEQSVWLDWNELPGIDTETRLSQLCELALRAHRRQQQYGLRLPGLEIVPARGDGHLADVLRALALFRNTGPAV